MEFDDFITRATGASAGAQLTLEEVLTSPEWMGLTSATPLQRAICRIADGKSIDDLRKLPLVPDVERYPADVQERATWDWAIGKWTGEWVPKEVYIPSAIRCGKSLISVARGLQMSQTVDMSFIPAGETPRFCIVSTAKDNADATYEHLVTAIKRSPRIASLVVGEPRKERTVLRHPSGREFEIAVVAGSRAGSSLVSRWLAGVVFDESTRMLSSEDGVINVDEQRKAVLGRMMPNAQLWYPGSPYMPMGLVYDTTMEFWRKPDDGTVVIRAVGPALNPHIAWTPERVWELHDSRRQADRDAYMTDCLAEFGATEGGWLTPQEWESVTRRTPVELPPVSGYHYVGVIDPATIGNAWTFVVAAQDRDAVRRVFVARQWQPSASHPLDSRVVFAEIAQVCRNYGIQHIFSDQWASTLLQERAQEVDLALIAESHTTENKADEMGTLCDLVQLGEVELVDVPHLLNDLKRARRKPLPRGVVTVSLPATADGRHCDFQPAVARAISKAVLPPDPVVEEELPDWPRNEVAKLHEYTAEPVGEDNWITEDDEWYSDAG